MPEQSEGVSCSFLYICPFILYHKPEQQIYRETLISLAFVDSSLRTFSFSSHSSTVAPNTHVRLSPGFRRSGMRLAPTSACGWWSLTSTAGERRMDIIHIDTILRAAHLIGIYADSFLPRHFKYSDTLDRFNAFYINKYADHHANEKAF
jgi:hypothetical protein